MEQVSDLLMHYCTKNDLVLLDNKLTEDYILYKEFDHYRKEVNERFTNERDYLREFYDTKQEI